MAEACSKIQFTGVLVENQDRALKFYTEVLGFQKSEEIPLRETRTGRTS